MTAHMQDFIELLNAEQHVQVDKLREHARHGVSARVRGEVWMYLLSVLSSDRTAEITFLLSLNSSYAQLPHRLPSRVVSTIHQTALAHHTRRFYNPTYAGLITSLTADPSTTGTAISGSQAATSSSSGGGGGSGASGKQQNQQHRQQTQHDQASQQQQLQLQQQDSQTLRSQYGRFLPPPPTTPPTRHAYLTTLEEVLGKYWNQSRGGGGGGDGHDDGLGKLQWQWEQQEGSERNWVYLATPFVCCFARPVAVFLAFQKMMDRIKTFPPFPSQLASLLTLFRQSQPELFAYFEDEQVRYVEVASSWLTTMLAKEMWLGDVLRLWDSYLASDDMFSLHCYVCVAILGTCKETLEELDGSEAKLMLLDLPPLDVDRLLQDAANLRVSFPLPMPVDE